MQYAQSLEQWAPDYAQVLDELASLLVRVATKQVVSDYESEEMFAPELIEKLAKAMSPEDAQLYYQTAITGRRDLHLAPEPRLGFEMTLLRMLAFRPAGRWRGGASHRRRQASQRGLRSAAATPRRLRRGRAQRCAGRRTVRQLARVWRAGVAGGARRRRGQALDSARTRRRCAAGSWGAIVAQLEISGLARQLANNCVLLGRTGNVVKLGARSAKQMMRTRARWTNSLRRCRNISARRCASSSRRPSRARNARTGGAAGGRGRVRLRAPVARVGPGRARVARDVRRHAAAGQRAAPQITVPSVRFNQRENSGMRGNIGNMMKQAQAMQANMQKVQAEIATIEVVGESGGGMVKVTMTGQHNVKRVQLEPAIVSEDREMLEDLIAAATNDAVKKVEVAVQAKMASVMGGMQLPPGFKMPF